MEAREYQNQAIHELRESFKRGNRKPMLMLPTGAGKTFIAIQIIKMALDKGIGVMFLCDRVQLIEQTSESFYIHGLDHNIIQVDNERYRPHLNLPIASVQTL